MFQNFDTPSEPETGKPRLAQLRKAMAAAKLDAFLIPRTDAHRGEVVPDRDERLAWLTGFSGSAGFAAATRDRAVLFVDGRYTLQVRGQVSAEEFEFAETPKDKMSDWLIEALRDGGKVGFDPWLLTIGEVEKLREAVSAKGIEVVPSGNLIDEVWEDQPDPAAEPVVVHHETFSGEAWAEKSVRVGRMVAEAGADAVVLTVPESICWLLNIRGEDVARTPVVLAFAVLYADGRLWLGLPDPDVCDQVKAHLGDAVEIGAKADFEKVLAGLTGKVGLDKITAPAAVYAAISAEIVEMRDPCVLPKAIKNRVEIAGAYAAQMRDGAAMVEFLAWLDAQKPGSFTEIDVVTALEGFRRATNTLKDISFETISGAGSHGAIVHYRVSEASNQLVEAGSILLVDSGGQYVDGTTDITRTMAIGPVLAEAIRPFTLVLKGMIAISRLRWPEGLAGRDLDAVARVALWQNGLEYDHGTGHGVGSYLGVHEGPAGLSRRSTEALKPGMILSNEPGYYREGSFGIRIENLVLVSEPSVPNGGDREMLGFETLTYVPIDRRLVDVELLTAAERDWFDGYHAEVARRHMDAVSPMAAKWLAAATAPI